MRWLSGRSEPQSEPPATAAVDYAVMPKALRVAAASLKGRAPVSDTAVAKVLADDVFPISAAVVREERSKEAAQRRAQEEALKNPQPGILVPGKGIFMGVWEPKDRNGRSIGKKFNLFGAPQDLTDNSGKKVLLTFKEAERQVAGLRNWNGHDGGSFENDAALYNALKDGSGVGKWFIPPKELVHGKDIDGNVVRVPNLYELRETGNLAGTFTTTRSGSDNAHWYWSATEHRDLADHVYVVVFTDGDDAWDHKDNNRLSCRPCRVELTL